MKILLVDDNATNRKLLRVTLESEGFATLEAADGVEALALLEQHAVQAVISDILMPRMDGFRLCQEVRKHVRLNRLPFIIYSATYTSPGDAKLALDCGADRYLRKPCPVPVMVAAIQEAAADAQHRHARHAPLANEAQVMREYNQALVQKLEERNAELEQQREWLRVTLTSIGDAVIATDSNSRVTFLNPVAEALTGWLQGKAMGQPIQQVFNIIDEQTSQPAADIVGRVLREGRIVRLANHTALVALDGRHIPIEDSAAPIKDTTGKVSGIVLVFHDVTEKRRAQKGLQEAQAKLQAYSEELEQTVARRTAKLEETINDLEHFSYAITHDMRAPLRAMQNFAILLGEECAGCERAINADYLRRIKVAANRLDRLITDSLNYGKTVRQELSLERVDLGELIPGLIDTYPNLQPDKADIKLIKPLPVVLGNPAALTQCFSNILGNAVKFSKPGTKPAIRIHAEISRTARQPPTSEVDTPAHVKIWIEDNGIGIPRDCQGRIFDLFQRATRDQEGTGLGLAIARKVIERMGGRVGVESQEGQGSRFWVELQYSEA